MPVAHRAQSSWQRGDGGDGQCCRFRFLQSFFVVPVPSPLPTGSLGQANTHEGLTDFLHGMLLHSLHRRLFQVRPFPFLPGVIMVPAFDRLLPMRTGHRRAGRGRHRDVQNAVRVELYMAAPVLKSLNPVCNRPPPIYASWWTVASWWTLGDGAVIEPSRMPFESSCPSLRLSWN
ncbi:uncharacterized protein LOC144159301 isoform X3 [Haemaphysalis longicornis]